MIPHFGLFQCPTAMIMSRKVEILEDVAVQMDVDYFSTQSMSIPTEDSWLDSDVSMMSSVVTCQDGRVTHYVNLDVCLQNVREKKMTKVDAN